jgi:hypothetical protein
MCTLANVQQAFADCGAQLQTFGSNVAEGASTAAIWIKDHAVAFKDYAIATANKAYDFVSPLFKNFVEWATSQFESIRDFVKNNPHQAAIIGGIAGLLGAIGAGITAYFCCQKDDAPPAGPTGPSGASAPAPSGASAPAAPSGASAPAARTGAVPARV